MNRIKLLTFCFLLLIGSMEGVFSQEKLNGFVITPDENCPFTIRPGDWEYGFVVINTTMSDLTFDIPGTKGRLAEKEPKYDDKKQQYILKIKPNDINYKSYKIKIYSKGFKPGEIEVRVKEKESKCFDVNPEKTSELEKLARITVYDKDNKLLVGAEVKNKTTGKVYGSTRYDGTLAINFDKKGETTNVIVSHPSYLDTKEITVQAGVHDYIVYLRNYNPSQGSKPSTNAMWYIIPGLGQIEMGEKTEGYATITGEALLLGGGIVSSISANKQLEIMRDVDILLGDFMTAKNKYNTLRAVNMTCYVGAAALYGFHLYRVYHLSKKVRDNRSASLTPAIITTDETMALGLSLNLNF